MWMSYINHSWLKWCFITLKIKKNVFLFFLPCFGLLKSLPRGNQRRWRKSKITAVQCQKDLKDNYRVTWSKPKVLPARNSVKPWNWPSSLSEKKTNKLLFSPSDLLKLLTLISIVLAVRLCSTRFFPGSRQFDFQYLSEELFTRTYCTSNSGWIQK